MLRIYFLQNLYDLADMRVMTEVNDSRAFSDFCGINTPDEMSDGDTIGRLRGILERNGIQEQLFQQVVHTLEKRENAVVINKKGKKIKYKIGVRPSSIRKLPEHFQAIAKEKEHKKIVSLNLSIFLDTF